MPYPMAIGFIASNAKKSINEMGPEICASKKPISGKRTKVAKPKSMILFLISCQYSLKSIER
jgi:hypothetical protein